MNRVKRLFNLVFVIGAGIFMLTGCGAKKADPSGFLGDDSVYEAMTENKELGLHDIVFQPGALRNYNTFIIEPVRIYLSEEGRKRNLDGEKLQQLADQFRSKIIEELSPHYHITSTPGRDVAIFRFAITDANPSTVALNVLPQMAMIGGPGIGGASMEAIAVDSLTYRPIAAAMDKRYGKRYRYTSGFSKWGHSEDVFGDWARTFRKRLDMVHEKK